jgi:hypothetical protein
MVIQVEPYLPMTCGNATASMICGIVGLVGCCCCPMTIGSLAAIVTGHIALSQIANRPGLQGRGMAVAGLIMGYLGLVVWLITTFSWLVNPELYKQINEGMEKAKEEIRQKAEPSEQKQKLPPDAT